MMILKMLKGEELDYIATRKEDEQERDDEAWVIERGHTAVHAARQSGNGNPYVGTGAQ